MHLLVELSQLGILQGLQLGLIGLLLELHQLGLHLQHMKPIRHQEVLLVLFQDFVELLVQADYLLVDAFLQCLNLTWSLRPALLLLLLHLHLVGSAGTGLGRRASAVVRRVSDTFCVLLAHARGCNLIF